MRIYDLSVLFFAIACIEEIFLMRSGFAFRLRAAGSPLLFLIHYEYGLFLLLAC